MSSKRYDFYVNDHWEEKIQKAYRIFLNNKKMEAQEEYQRWVVEAASNPYRLYHNDPPDKTIHVKMSRFIFEMAARGINDYLKSVEVSHSHADTILSNERLKTPDGKRLIIPFPTIADSPIPAQHRSQSTEEAKPIEPILAPEGTPLPEGITDIRPLLRRDGLLLLSWKQMKTCPRTYEVFWVRKTGRRFTYASGLIAENDLGNAMPSKSIKFFDIDNTSPFQYWVHVAPAALVRDYPDPRPEYIKKLEAMGIDTGSDVEFTLSDSIGSSNIKAV